MIFIRNLLTKKIKCDIIIKLNADMSELADESDSKSDGKPCGFDPHYPHQGFNGDMMDNLSYPLFLSNLYSILLNMS